MTKKINTEKLSVEVQELLKQRKELEKEISTKTNEFAKDWENKQVKINELEHKISILEDFIASNELAKKELEVLENSKITLKDDLQLLASEKQNIVDILENQKKENELRTIELNEREKTLRENELEISDKFATLNEKERLVVEKENSIRLLLSLK